MIPHSEGQGRPLYGGPGAIQGRWTLLPDVSRGHVLMVEDDEDVRDGLRPVLEDEGYEVSFASNGRDALKRLSTETLPDQKWI
jgi:PleD family two-component response regulator